MALTSLNTTLIDENTNQAQTDMIPPTTTPATIIAPDTKPLEPQVGTIVIPAFWVLLAPELAAPLAASLWEALAARLEMAAALDVALAMTLPESLAEEAEDEALLPPIPGLSSKETSLARSPHRASRAGGQLHRFVERNTNLRRRVEYRSNRSTLPISDAAIYGEHWLTHRNNA